MSRILLIDDDNDFRRAVKLMLEQSGFEVLEADNTKTGLEITGKYFINLVITDLYMPEVDGIQTIIKFKEKFPGLKLMAMTGACSDGRTECLLKLAKEKGAIDVFKKGDDIHGMLDKVKAVLGE